jgi:hypothetical protein
MVVVKVVDVAFSSTFQVLVVIVAVVKVEVGSSKPPDGVGRSE